MSNICVKLTRAACWIRLAEETSCFFLRFRTDSGTAGNFFPAPLAGFAAGAFLLHTLNNLISNCSFVFIVDNDDNFSNVKQYKIFHSGKQQ